MKLSDDEESEPLQRQQNGLRKVGRRGRPNLLPWLIAAAGSAIIIGAVILPLSSRYSLWMMLLPPSAKTLRLSAAEAEAMARRHRFLFIAGPHRGGTTLLWRLLRLHPQVGAFAERTDGDFSEGAFLQSVMPTFGVGREREDCLRAGVRRVGSPPARGVGRYGFDPGAHLTEASPLASLASRDALLSQWGYYWGEAGLERPLLLEKTPTNMLTARLLQSLFAPRTSFLVVTRHPLAVALAQHRITSCGGGGGGGGPPEAVGEAVLHWALTHTVLQRDLAALSSARVVRYEDLAHAPGRCLAAVGLRASRTPGPFLEASSCRPLPRRRGRVARRTRLRGRGRPRPRRHPALDRRSGGRGGRRRHERKVRAAVLRRPTRHRAGPAVALPRRRGAPARRRRARLAVRRGARRAARVRVLGGASRLRRGGPRRWRGGRGAAAAGEAARQPLLLPRAGRRAGGRRGAARRAAAPVRWRWGHHYARATYSSEIGLAGGAIGVQSLRNVIK